MLPHRSAPWAWMPSWVPDWLKAAVVDAVVLYGARTGWLTVIVSPTDTVPVGPGCWYRNDADALNALDVKSSVDGGMATVNVACTVPPPFTFLNVVGELVVTVTPVGAVSFRSASVREVDPLSDSTSVTVRWALSLVAGAQFSASETLGRTCWTTPAIVPVDSVCWWLHRSRRV